MRVRECQSEGVSELGTELREKEYWSKGKD